MAMLDMDGDDDDGDEDEVPISTASSPGAKRLIEAVEHAMEDRPAWVAPHTPIVGHLRGDIMRLQYDGFKRQRDPRDGVPPDATMELDMPCVIRGVRGLRGGECGMLALTCTGPAGLHAPLDGHYCTTWEGLCRAKKERLGAVLAGEGYSADSCVGEPLRIAPSVGLSEMCLLGMRARDASVEEGLRTAMDSPSSVVRPSIEGGAPMLTVEGCENAVLEPHMLFGMPAGRFDDGTCTNQGLVCLKNCRNVTVSGSVFVGHGAAYGLRIEGCQDVHVVGCSFFGCGISIRGDFERITIRECDMQAVVGGQGRCSMHAPGPLLSIEGPAGPPLGDGKGRLVRVVEGSCRVRLCDESLLPQSLYDGMASAVSPCFLSVRGQCTLDVRNTRVVGPIGSIGPSATFQFIHCSMDMDTRLKAPVRQVGCFQAFQPPLPARFADPCVQPLMVCRARRSPGCTRRASSTARRARGSSAPCTPRAAGAPLSRAPLAWGSGSSAAAGGPTPAQGRRR